jgi:hypothetical protein
MRSPSSHRSVLLVLSAAAMFAVAACGGIGATPVTQASAEAIVCENVAALGDSVETLVGLDASTASIEDVQAGRDAVRSAWDTVKTSVAAIPDADEAAMEAAVVALETSVTDMPTDVPISEAVGGVQTAAGGVQSVVTEIENGVGCP